MNKKNYQKPTMNIVKLQHQSHLMVGSERTTKETLRNYDWDDEIDEE